MSAMHRDRARSQRSIRNLLIDRRFQLKYTLVIVVAGGVLFGAMEALFYEEVRQNSQLALLSPDSAFGAELQARLLAEDRKVLLVLVGFWLALVSTLFFVGLAATHRIVGPLQVMDRYLRRIKEGGAVHPRPLRRGDEFHALYARVNEMAEGLRAQRAAELEALQKVIDRTEVRLQAMRAGPETAEAAAGLEVDLAPLHELVEKKRAWLALPDEDAVDHSNRN